MANKMANKRMTVKKAENLLATKSLNLVYADGRTTKTFYCVFTKAMDKAIRGDYNLERLVKSFIK